jgi:hypothetical protein
MSIDHSDALVFFGATGDPPDARGPEEAAALTEAHGGWFAAA